MSVAAAPERESITFNLTPEQVDLVRRILFERIESLAESLASDAAGAGGDLEPGVQGLDARSVYRTLREVTELLDVFRWAEQDERHRPLVPVDDEPAS